MTKLCPTMVRLAAWSTALVVLSAGRPAAAQTQVKPYMMVIFDNSGSMAGTPLTQAKTALTNIVSSTGDVVFGLERFTATCGTCAACPTCGTCSAYTCNTTATSGQILAGLDDEGQNALLLWVNQNCGGNPDTGADPELIAYTNTPLQGSLLAAQAYYTTGGTWLAHTYTSPIAIDPYRGCRPYYVVLLTDGDETCTGTPANGATSLRTTSTVSSLTCTTVADCCPTGTCRASGAGTPTCTGGHCRYEIQTWAIGFRTGTPYASIENIATAGGTDCPGGNRGCYATDSATLSGAFSDIISGSLLVETCNGIDDNCNGVIDEGFTKYCNRPSHPAQDLCTDPGETLCNGVDDNCNGLTDEGLLNACGTCGAAPTEICDGIDNDCDGATDEGGVCVSGCTPTSEVCDNRDNDCDGLTDEGITRPCGSSIGQCRPGTQICSAGVWGACTGGTLPTTEACNNLDDDCDGRTDGMTRTCGTDVGVCEFGTELCTTGAWSGVCVGAYNGSAEICNLLDDDCDGSTDEGDPGGGGECGAVIGECRPGIRHCIGGTLTCSGGAEPVPEVCDNRDNDCDGSTDEGNPGGGGDCYSGPAGTAGVGVCEGGVLRCTGGALICDGEVLPRPEDCNLLDDDCDGATDEGLATGGTCGTDVGECTAGVRNCVGGAWVCEGEVPPTEEICDLLDNDCDGDTDEGNPGGGVPCGWSADPATWDTGECEPGVSDCVAGTLTCEGMIGPVPEECNGLDDDCNGLTDDGLGVGEPCGTDEGECTPGVNRCVDGRTQCDGGSGPTDESCDCLDNDCDGSTDEDNPCSGGAACIAGADACTCSLPCDYFAELNCPSGRTCTCGVWPTDPTLCFCVPEVETCGTETCAACERCNTTTLHCEAIECPRCQHCDTSSELCSDDCAGVACDPGFVCECGACVEPDCYSAGHDCPAGQQCQPDADTGRGVCVEDTCYHVTCDAPQFCRDGTCHDPCELTDICPPGQVCYDGTCRDDPCHDVTCPNPGDECVGGTCTSICATVTCAWPLTCDPATGACREPTCLDVHCPDGYECVNDTCFERSHPADDQDGGDGSGGDAQGVQVIATGAGGCACSAAAPSGGPTGLFSLLGLIGAAFLARRRGR